MQQTAEATSRVDRATVALTQRRLRFNSSRDPTFNHKKVNNYSKTKLDLSIHPYFLTIEELETAFEELYRELKPKFVVCPFISSSYGENRLNRSVYSYVDAKVEGTFYSDAIPVSTAWPAQLLAIKKAAAEAAGSEYNYCLVNLYEDGTKSIGYHRDSSECLVEKSSIATVSLGATRTMCFKPCEHTTLKYCKGNASLEPLSVTLRRGSLLIMHHPTNKYWMHSIPKETRCDMPRMSLTFRHMYES